MTINKTALFTLLSVALGLAALTATADCPAITLTPETLPDVNVGLSASYEGGTWADTGSLSVLRGGTTATLLTNGSVLLVGNGVSGPYVRSTELYDPATGLWTTNSSLAIARSQHTATLLADGKVLVAGGYGGTNNGVTLASAELYDPVTGVWTNTGSLNFARYNHEAVLLTNGQVLVVGGFDSGNYFTNCELYDPATGVWTPTGSTLSPRDGHTVTLLADGKVLVTGGASNSGAFQASAELYDPATGLWTATGSLSTNRSSHAATLLSNGKVLVTGGRSSAVQFNSSVELYDPATGAWTSKNPMSVRRFAHTSTLLPNGLVLVAAGASSLSGSITPPANAELYDPVAETWTAAGTLNTPRSRAVATLLPNGKVLISAGRSYAASGSFIATSELFEGSHLVSAAGGVPPYSYAVTAGSLPKGLQLASDGSLTGVPFGLGTNAFTVTATDANGCTGNSNYSLAVTGTGNPADTIPPTLTVTYPVNKSTVTNYALTITGTATDTVFPSTGVAMVLYSFNGGAQQLATRMSNSNNWTVNVVFTPGWNTFTAQSVDYIGNVSPVVSNRYFLKALWPLGVVTNGHGKGSFTNNMPLALTSTNTITAIAGPGYFFSNWVNSATGLMTNTPKYTFIMQSNLVLTANFVTNNWAGYTGTYNGLFFEAGGVTHDSSGFATIKATASATKPPMLSGSLKIAGQSITLSGSFDIAGNWVNPKPLKAAGDASIDLSVRLQLLRDGSDTIIGVVSNNLSHWSAELSCDRAKVITNYDGRYTMIMPHDTTGAQGDSFGSVNVTNGALELYGLLADNTPFKQKVNVSSSGLWPLYVAGNKVTTTYATNFYAAHVIGWLTLTTNGPTGTAYWTKVATPPAYDRYYNTGFTNSSDVISSPYVYPAAGTRVIPLGGGTGNGLITLDTAPGSGGILSNACVLSTANTFTCATNYGVRFTSVKVSQAFGYGTLQGQYQIPGTNLNASFFGMVLQNSNEARGFFFTGDTNYSSGLFLLR